VGTLASFSERHQITFPLLSDGGSVVIRSLGMLDEDLEAHHAFYGLGVQEHQRGVAYPGVFLLDTEGKVVQKRFLATYRERESGGTLLETALDIAASVHGAMSTVADAVVQVQAALDAPAYRRYMWHRLVLDLAIAPDFHVYGMPIPEGYVPLTLHIEPIDDLVVGEVTRPAPHLLQVAGLDEDFFGYDGAIRGTIPVSFQVVPDAGDQILSLTVSYQACRRTDCLPPASVHLDLVVPQAAAVVD
jgi:hypothetical protein